MNSRNIATPTNPPPHPSPHRGEAFPVTLRKKVTHPSIPTWKSAYGRILAAARHFRPRKPRHVDVPSPREHTSVRQRTLRRREMRQFINAEMPRSPSPIHNDFWSPILLNDSDVRVHYGGLGRSSDDGLGSAPSFSNSSSVFGGVVSSRCGRVVWSYRGDDLPIFGPVPIGYYAILPPMVTDYGANQVVPVANPSTSTAVNRYTPSNE